MTLVPEYDTFATDYALGKNQIVYTRLAADLDTPVSLMLKLTGAHKDAFVLVSDRRRSERPLLHNRNET